MKHREYRLRDRLTNIAAALILPILVAHRALMEERTMLGLKVTIMSFIFWPFAFFAAILGRDALNKVVEAFDDRAQRALREEQRKG